MGGLIDPIGRLVIMGAALGGIGGPIGMGAGAVLGLIYGLTQRERIKREAEQEMNRQKELDKAQEQEIEARRKHPGGGQAGGARTLGLDAQGLVVLEDHLAGEQTATAGLLADAASITGLTIVEDHLAPVALQASREDPDALSASRGEPSIRSEMERRTARLSRHVDRGLPRAGGDAGQNGQGTSQPTEADLRRKQLEQEIETELLRQKELLARMRQTMGEGPGQSAGLPSEPGGAASALPAPPVRAATPAGGTTSRLAKADAEGFIPVFEGGRLARRERDLKGVGRPDTILYYDAGGQVVRKEESTRFDGRIDAWSYYASGRLARKEADTNGDGRVDFWAVYTEQGDLLRTESDSTLTGRRDLIQEYQNGEIVREERLGPAGDRPRVVLVYEGGRVIRKEEDTNGAGRMDRISFFDPKGRLVKQVRDPKGQSAPAESLFFDPATGELVRKEEDLRGNGTVGAISYFEGGRLIRRELFDLEELPIRRIAVLSADGGPAAAQAGGTAGDAGEMDGTPARGGRRE